MEEPTEISVSDDGRIPDGVEDGGRSPSNSARIHSFAIVGVEAIRVEVEVAIRDGYPDFSVVGSPGAAIRESRERVHAAFRSAGISLRARKTVINLAPAELRKDGSAFDLPIALAILAAHGQIDPSRIEAVAAAGELSLDGRLRPIRGALAMGLAAASFGCEKLILPSGSLAETTGIARLVAQGAESLAELCLDLGMARETLRLPDRPVPGTRTLSNEEPIYTGPAPEPILDLGRIQGQSLPKRALEVAAAGGHNLLFIGPPGAGKTLLARALPGILPPMEEAEGIEATVVHSVAGSLSRGTTRLRQRPFRAPHHSISGPGLVGGGTPVRPGEVSLAHRGVLFLDELPEFSQMTLNLLRQPVEEGHVIIVRATGAVRFPSQFILVAAMNPCPCGFFGHPVKPCQCTETQVRNYTGRIGGPLSDRIDLHVKVPAVSSQEISGRERVSSESSRVVADRVRRARERQCVRFGELDGIYDNGQMGIEELERFCRLRTGESAFLTRATDALSLSARAVHRCLRVARTIADLDGQDRVSKACLAEAIQYRAI